MFKRTPTSGPSIVLLRILFQFLWELRALRPIVRRFWPARKMNVGGHVFLLHPGDNYTERFMWRKGMRGEAASIGRTTLLVAGKRALIFDVGANCGAFTLPLATSAAPGSRIVAFEPNPVLAKRLRTNLELNSLTEKVEVVEVALGESDGEAALHLFDDNLGRSSLRTMASVKSISVTVRPLVEFLPDQSRHYDIFIMKVDVEGFEDQVLVPFLSAAPAESIPHAILLETHRDDSWNADLRGVLKQRGFVPFFEGEEQNTLYLRLVANGEPDR